jgi:hypothetical protein
LMQCTLRLRSYAAPAVGTGWRTKSVNEKSSEDAGLCCFSRKFYKVAIRLPGDATAGDRSCSGKFRMRG